MEQWVLTENALNKVLASLHDRPDLAAAEYEKLRTALIRFFEWRGAYDAAELTDVTFNRVAKNLEAGKDIWTGKPSSYFYGVARNVLREYWDRQTPVSLDALPGVQESLADPQRASDNEDRENRELMMDCLEKCLKQLQGSQRDLILNYYQAEGGQKIALRKQLADQMGVTTNALKIRTHRIRDGLEKCGRDCVESR